MWGSSPAPIYVDSLKKKKKEKCKKKSKLVLDGD
jgi:hypothetical protein